VDRAVCAELGEDVHLVGVRLAGLPRSTPSMSRGASSKRRRRSIGTSRRCSRTRRTSCAVAWGSSRSRSWRA